MSFTFKTNTITNAINGNFYTNKADIPASNDSHYRNVTVKQIHKLAEKQKWMKRFASAYAEGVNAICDAMFCSSTKFFVAMDGDKELGYVRLVNHSAHYDGYVTNEVWCLSDAYVKPAYRSSGVLRKLIEHVLKYENVQEISITDYRYAANEQYYKTLGFTAFSYCDETDLGYALQSNILPILHKMKADYYARQLAA